APPPVRELEHPPPAVHHPRRPARALGHLRRRQLPPQAVLRGGPGPAGLRRPRSPTPLGRAHLAARLRRVGLTPAPHRHCFNAVSGPRLARLAAAVFARRPASASASRLWAWAFALASWAHGSAKWSRRSRDVPAVVGPTPRAFRHCQTDHRPMPH